jgi:ABC-2 type transport system permease protein
MMTIVIFPMSVLSSAVYPLWKTPEGAGHPHYICAVTPFTHVVEQIRCLLYLQMKRAPSDRVWVSTAIFAGIALWA